MISINLNELDEGQHDLEPEQQDESESGRSPLLRPYDPTLIRVEPKMFSLRNILDMIDEGEIDLAPDFQRLRVWSAKQKSRLIESILLRIPLPAFYFASDLNGRLQVVDGVQRLSTIHAFVRGDVPSRLSNLEYLSDELAGKTFEDIKNSVWSKRLHGTQIVANVIDPQTPAAVKFDIFKRINTGGTPLNSQEIRHCMSLSRSRDLLKDAASLQSFALATGGGLVNNVRMADREMVLRVAAFSLLGLDEYYRSDGLDDFLNSVTARIDNGYYDEIIPLFLARFDHSMKVAYGIFGDNAFRKWGVTEGGRRSPINRAIFEAVSTTILTTEDSRLKGVEDIIYGYRFLCSNDPSFIASVTQSTSSAGSVAERFSKIRELMIQ